MNERELNAKIFDQILKYTAEKQVGDIAHEYSEIESEISYSSNFIKGMDNFFNRNRRKDRIIRIRRIILKSAAAVILFFIISAAVVFNVEALRVPFLNFIEHPGQQFTKIETKDQNVNYELFFDQIHGMYLSAFLPDSYSVESINKVGQNSIVIFKNLDGGFINFQNISENSVATIDNEDVYVENIPVNGCNAQLYEKNCAYTLVFVFENNVFILSGPLSKDDILKVAESLIYYQ